VGAGVGEGGKLRGKKDIININHCAYMKWRMEKFSNRMRSNEHDRGPSIIIHMVGHVPHCD
jgi:hypothetical protein